MGDAQLPCVEHLPGRRKFFGTAVNRVSRDRVSERCHVHTNLMGSAGENADFRERGFDSVDGSCFCDMETCDGFASAVFDDRHFLAVRRMAPDQIVELACLHGEVPVKDCGIGLGYLARGKCFREFE